MLWVLTIISNTESTIAKKNKQRTKTVEDVVTKEFMVMSVVVVFTAEIGIKKFEIQSAKNQNIISSLDLLYAPLNTLSLPIILPS